MNDYLGEAAIITGQPVNHHEQNAARKMSLAAGSCGVGYESDITQRVILE